MKENKIEKGIEEIKKMTMTPDEKGRMLNMIFNSEELVPNNPVVSPWFGTSILLRIPKRSLAFYVAIPLIIVLGSGGLVFASQESLPNETLYTLKVEVIEPVRGAMILSNENKAKYESSLAKERLVEAETLAVSGKLDSSNEEKINTLLEKHSVSLNKALEKVNEEKSGKEADEIAVNFRAEMNAHARILDTIASEEIDSPDMIQKDSSISKMARSNADNIIISFKEKDENFSEEYDKKKNLLISMIESKKENIPDEIPTKVEEDSKVPQLDQEDNSQVETTKSAEVKTEDDIQIGETNTLMLNITASSSVETENTAEVKPEDDIKISDTSTSTPNTMATPPVATVKTVEVKPKQVEPVYDKAQFFLNEAERKEREGDKSGAYLELLKYESSIREDNIFFEAKAKLNKINIQK